MKPKTIALLHPGNMGATVGAAAKAGGVRVIWASQGRSGATRERAELAGLVDVVDLPTALAQSEVVLSICPPHAALAVAHEVAASKFQGTYVDANAVSRSTAEEIGRVVRQAGASFVDGGIIGSPVKQAGTTRLYLSGDGAEQIAELFSGTLLDARAIGDRPGAASALKLAYAAWTKCSDILAIAIRGYADHEGVDAALLEEWAISQPALAKKCDRAARVAVPKAWRYVGEMQEIAEAFKTAGLPGGFHDAAAELCQQLVCFKDQTDPAPSVAAVLKVLGSKTGTGEINRAEHAAL